MVSIFEEFEGLLNSHTKSDVNIDYGWVRSNQFGMVSTLIL